MRKLRFEFSFLLDGNELMPSQRSNFTVLITLFLVTAIPTPLVADDVAQWTAKQLPDFVEIYRHFHANPELSFKEKKTAARLAKELTRLGAQVTTGVGGHGVVGILRNGVGPTLMLRTDLDGLPVTEQTQLVYASKLRAVNQTGDDVGVMHACGHDVHLTNLIGVAQYLAQHRNVWSGTVMFIGQPAEERGAGAKAMLEDGLFTRFPRPDFAVALHVDAAMAAGKVGYRAGFALANVDSVDITVKGRGGHGAYPQTTVDPIVQAAQLVLALQTIVSREVPPTEPAVITVGSIHGGTKHNVIGDNCHLQITVRSYSDHVRKLLLEGIKRKTRTVAMEFKAPEPEIKISEGTPALFNDEDLANQAGIVFQRVFGAERVEQAEQSMGGEDFSRYGREGVPILMFRLGTVEQRRLDRYQQLGQVPPSLHSSKFYPDAELTLATAITATTELALELLKSGQAVDASR
ncbi:MAG: amidohydrolase [Pirellulaceae bacterium]|nr:amidohydrolase [Pirellulaceae bacterium]